MVLASPRDLRRPARLADGKAPAPAPAPDLAVLAGRARPVALAREQLLPVLPPLVPLLPHGGLQRGTVIGVDAEPGGHLGATSLALALLAGASQTGVWTAAVGLTTLGPLTASELGVDLARFALVPDPGVQWSVVTAALLDAVDALIVRAPARARLADVRRLTARARERGAVVITTGGWAESPALRLTVSAAEWHGLGDGFGHLQSRRVEVAVTGRRSAARERREWLWLPDPNGVGSAPPPPNAGAPEPERLLDQVSKVG